MGWFGSSLGGKGSSFRVCGGLRLLLFAQGLCVSACVVGPREPPKLLGQVVSKPVALWLRVSSKASDQNDLGGTLTLIETLTEKLKAKGVESRLFTSESDHPHPPRIEILVEEWEVGDRSARAFAPVFVPIRISADEKGSSVNVGLYGNYCVVVEVMREGDWDPAFVKRYEGTIYGSSETTSANLGESIAGSILRDVGLETWRPTHSSPDD
jgi:hypothetical protein